MAQSDPEIEAWRRRQAAAQTMPPSLGNPAALAMSHAPPSLLPTSTVPPPLNIERPAYDPDFDLREREKAADARVAKLPGARPAPQAPPPQQQPGATVTSNMGGIQVQQQLPPGGDISQRSSHSGKSESFTTPTAAESGLVTEQKANEAKQLENATAARDHAVKVAQVEADAAAAKDTVTASENLRKQQVMDETEAQVKRTMVAEREADIAYQQEAKNNPKGFFASDRTTGQKIAGGIALVLGFFGGADGSNVGADALLAAVERDNEAWKERVQNKLQIFKNSKGNTVDAMAETERQMGLAEVRKLSALESILTTAKSKAAALGMDAAAIEGNAGLSKIQSTITDGWMKREEGLRKKVAVEKSFNSTTTTGGAGGAGGMSAVSAMNANAKALEAQQDAEATERFAALAEKDPKAYLAVQKAMNDAARLNNWGAVKGGVGDLVNAGKAVGFAAQDVQARLKGNPAALEMFSALSPVITAKAREADPVGAINQDAVNTAEERLGLRSRDARAIASEARAMGKRKRELAEFYRRGGGAAPAAPMGAPAGQPAQQQPQAAQPRRGSVNGKPAMIYPDGTYEAL